MAAPQRKLLFVTRTSPFRGESGSGAYVADLLNHLVREGFRIRVLWTEPPDLVPSRGWYAPPAEAGKSFDLEIPGLLKIGPRFWKPAVVWLPFKAHSLHLIKTSLQRLGLWRRVADRRSGSAKKASAMPAPAWGQPCTPVEMTAVHQTIKRWKPNVVIANYAWMAPAVRANDETEPPFAVLTHDVRHRQLRLQDGRVVEELGEFMSHDEERALLQTADALIAIQEPEAAVFRRMFPGKTVVTAPMSVHPREISPPSDRAVLFVGSAHPPNIAGVTWFLDRVWPALKSEFPGAAFLIAGSVCSAFPNPLPAGVRLLGRLPDLAVAYAQAGVVIAPIFQGSGIKIKLLEAIGFGRACVTTSVGLEGLEALREELCIADSAEAFVRATRELLADPAQAARLGSGLQSKARKHLSAGACYGPVADLLRTLSSRSH